jgi:hypothetical protein
MTQNPDQAADENNSWQSVEGYDTWQKKLWSAFRSNDGEWISTSSEPYLQSHARRIDLIGIYLARYPATQIIVCTVHGASFFTTIAELHTRELAVQIEEFCQSKEGK